MRNNNNNDNNNNSNNNNNNNKMITILKIIMIKQKLDKKKTVSKGHKVFLVLIFLTPREKERKKNEHQFIGKI